MGDPLAMPAAATLQLYAGDWAHFAAWCWAEGRPALPASSETLAAYLLAAAPGLSRGALGRRRAAVGTTHRQAGCPVPLLDADAHRAIRAAAKPKAAQQRSKSNGAALVRMATRCSRDLAGLRDRALLLLAAAITEPARGQEEGTEAGQGGVPRRCLLLLDAEDVRLTASGVTLALRRAPGDPAPNRAVALTRHATAARCPVRALEEWLRGSDTAYGPVFRKVDRWGNAEHTRLAPDAWNRILARRSRGHAAAATG